MSHREPRVMGSRVPANLSSAPLFPSDQRTIVNHPVDVEERLDDSKTDVEESSHEEPFDIHRVN